MLRRAASAGARCDLGTILSTEALVPDPALWKWKFSQGMSHSLLISMRSDGSCGELSYAAFWVSLSSLEPDERRTRSHRAEYPERALQRLDLFEALFLGQARQVLDRIAGMPRQDVNEDAPGGRRYLRPRRLQRFAHLPPLQNRGQAAGQLQRVSDHAAQRPEALKDDAQNTINGYVASHPWLIMSKTLMPSTRTPSFTPG